MHKLDNDTWQENRIPKHRRPGALPEQWGAHWLAQDLVSRWNSRSFLDEEEPLYAIGVTAYQYMLADGPPWTCFRTHEFDPLPTYESDAPAGSRPNWGRFDVGHYADFLTHYEGGWPPARVAQILQRMDLFADYMVAARVIDDATRLRWIEDAKRVIDALLVTKAA